MKIITYNHHHEYFYSGIWERYFGGMSFCVFDIETLGLNPAFCPVVLAGVMTVESSGDCLLTQYFAETPEDEKDLLKTLGEYLNRFDFILTYNGRHFDVPFIKKRAEACGLADFSVTPYNLDLYLVIRGHSSLRHILKSLRQSSVEEYMGLSSKRFDEISGKESVDLYREYLKCSDSGHKAALMDKILLHNHDDLMQLYGIVPVIRQTDFHNAMFTLGFPIKGENGWPDFTVKKLNLSSKSLTVSGNLTERCCDYIPYTGFSSPFQPFSCTITKEGRFEFTFPVTKTPDAVFANAAELLGDTSALKMLSGHINGFLILCEQNKRNPLEINMLSRELLLKFMNETPCI